jgi:hypothetical protein
MWRDGGWGALGAAIGAVLISGCGGGTAKPTLTLENAALCTGAWTALTTPEPYDVTSPLVYSGGTLYYTRFSTQSLVAQPASGGAPTVIAQTFTDELWGEGDHLLFAAGNLGNQVFSLPFGGGTPTLVLDGGAGRTAPGVALHHAFTATDFYWTETSTAVVQSPTAVWQQSRSGGTASQIGSFTFTVPGSQEITTGEGIAVSADAVLVADDFGSASAVPVDGSPPRSLAAPVTSARDSVSLAGIDGLGAYWSVFSLSNNDFEVIRSPADGSPAQPFWKSSIASVSRMWSDGNGGWVAFGLEVFDDGVDHAVIQTIDAQGTATRLGCSPGRGLASWIENPVAIAPDGIYAITTNLDATTWEIDRIGRATP